MATLYRRGGKKNKRGTWYIQYFNELGKRKTVRGCNDKEATEALASKLETDMMLRREGVIDPKADRYAQEGRRPIREHFEEWKQDMVARGVTEKQINLAFNRVTRLFEAAEIQHIAAITPWAVQNVLGQMRDQGRAAKTLNDILSSAKQFCTWLRRNGRIAENPLDHMKGYNKAVDRRHDRRALTEEELRRLLTAAEQGPIRQGFSGLERALIYRLAVSTGLRANEIATLTSQAFHLNGAPPTVTVEAAFSKHRRKDVQPLPLELISHLQAHLVHKRPGELLFPLTKNFVEALRFDLERAQVDYKTHAGYADFHALRHTFITRLIQAGVNPKTAQVLARHRDASLTLNTYSHVELIDQVAALKKLPNLDALDTFQENQPAWATGTHGQESKPSPGEKASAVVGTGVGSCAAFPGAERHSVATGKGEPRQDKVTNLKVLGTAWQDKSRSVGQEKNKPKAGEDPALFR